MKKFKEVRDELIMYVCSFIFSYGLQSLLFTIFGKSYNFSLAIFTQVFIIVCIVEHFYNKLKGD